MIFLAILVLLISLVIAGVAAYFSIIGLALLFVGSGQSIIIMGSALEVGKLVVVSFLHHYWEKLGILLKSYLILATIFLMGITSVGIYGYLSNGYNATSNKVKEIERQVAFNNNQIEELQKDNNRLNLFEFKTTNDLLTNNKDKFVTQQLELIKQKESRIAAERNTAEQEKKKIIEEQNNAKVILDAEINKEIEQIKIYNARLEILDKEIQTWLDQGTGGLFKANGIEKARQVKQLQEKERAQIDEQIKIKQTNIEKLRAEYNTRIQDLVKISEKVTSTLNSTIKQFELDITKDKQAIEEYQIKTDKLVAEQETIKEAKQKEAKDKVKINETDIEKLRSANNTLQGKIFETDVGTFKFVAKSLGIELDQAVNWFIWAIMFVFDPLAVSLVICFNFLIKHRKPKETPFQLKPTITPTPTATLIPTLTPTPIPTLVEPQEQFMASNTSSEIISGKKKIKQPVVYEGEAKRIADILEAQRQEKLEREARKQTEK
jgi:hypothetical protein